MFTADFHTDGKIRLRLFMPSNNMSLSFGAGSNSIALYGIDGPRAWAMFDLFRDENTTLCWRGVSMTHRDNGPTTFAEHVEAARAATETVAEDCPREVHEADMAGGGAS